ncbi:outer membrane lipoprotein-sorting protein [Aliiroseovarius crassostreae]|uniref:Outer membrane lipoprotein-sorting protein n=1 Tax=Aliiroseovarius crassostreae TaxID=154981 RepID=A0A9Q9LV94_9RHOB|nr:outer membrane lipoprotein-sorting protein [Aliiroseovarius crassostreae]UWP90871.1 outer membrane lipoprotein-sorting protein [Aliiroseovarius crassostreae]UWP97200.1 outer membrane lipoprotein-sorting protein [Aliiroseovarius crassostreae]UWQ00384.1 outer membrane lipoprotein-sorting protein [Aliiroseovarius crassostreae]
MTLDRRTFGQLMLGSLATAGLSGVPLSALAAGDATAILKKADAIRNPQTSFVVDVNLVNYERGRAKEKTKVTTYSRPTGAQFQTLVHIDSPAADRGKILLRNGNILWLYDPASKASVRISPRQRLLGNASNGDVVSSNLVGDYSVRLAGQETVVDGDRKERSCTKLMLTQSASSAPYSAVEFWVDASSNQPVKGKYFTKSGKLIKVAWYRKFKSQMGTKRPTEIVIADGFDPNKVTVMTMSKYRAQDIPSSWFNKEWLPNFRA